MTQSPASTLRRMLAIFDVESVAPQRFAGMSDGGGRQVVDGSQLLAQAIVATAKTMPRHTVRSAHAVFSRTVRDDEPIELAVDVVHEGRTFASARVAVAQGDRRCAVITVLADVVHDDLIRHHAAMPAVGDPREATPIDMPLEGREVRIVAMNDPNDPDEVGPPVLDAWVHYGDVPPRDDLAKALLAHFTGHLSISTTMRPHRGIGTAQSHKTLSTGVITIGVSFHEPVVWDGWLLYHHVSTQAGAGMSYVQGQVFTESGDLLASFTQEGMIRAFGGAASGDELSETARL